MTAKAHKAEAVEKVPADLTSAGAVDPELGMTRVRSSSSATIRMVKDESVLEVASEDVAAHTRMGFRVAGDKE